MEDLFLNATSDLDKILDEFEQREAPNNKQIQKKSVAIKPNTAKSANFLDKKDVFLSKILEPTKSTTENSNKSTSSIVTLSSSSYSNEVTDMLIDFSTPTISAPASANETVAVQNNTLQDLDFLLSVLPQSDNVCNSDLASGDGDSAVCHNLPANSVQNISTVQSNEGCDVAKPVVGFDSDVQFDDSEFNEFMKEPSNLTISIRNREVSTTNNSKSELLLDVNDKNIENNETRDPSYVKSIEPPLEANSEFAVEDLKTKSKPKFKKVFQRNFAPMPSSSVHSPSHSDINISTKNVMSQGHSGTSRPIAGSELNLNQQAGSSSPVKSAENAKLKLQSGKKSKNGQETPSVSQSIGNQQLQETPSVSQSIGNQQLPGSSPPSYSSVVAGEYKAGTIVQTGLPISSPTSSRQPNDTNQTSSIDFIDMTQEHVEQALEATEEDGNDMVNPSSTSTQPNSTQSNSSVIKPGLHKPYWVPDEDSSVCTKCQSKFTFTRRRHHCRACGRIFCNSCCNERMKLAYLKFVEARVCLICVGLNEQVNALSQQSSHAAAQVSPVSVLRTEHATNHAMPKSVRFSDGTKPHHPSVLPSTPPPPPVRAHRSTRGNRTGDAPSSSNFPPLILEFKAVGSPEIDENPDSDFVLTLLRTSENDATTFALSANLFVMVKLMQYCSTTCYYFLSSGLDCVGQAEVAVLLEIGPEDQSFPIKVFTLYTHLFNMARKGKTVQANDFLQVEEISNQSGYLIGSTDYAGFFFVRRTVQDVEGLNLIHPEERSLLYSPTVQFSSTLFVLMVHKSEIAWTKLFFPRFLLGLGAKHKQYPYPLVNFLNRDPIYTEVGNTILGILCDFRNFKYKVVSVPGLSVLIGQNGVSLNIPCNRFTDIMKIMNSSNEHVIAFGSDTFLSADDTQSHLVSVQDSLNRVYNSSVLSNVELMNDDNSRVGAAFIVLNGSLKSGSSQQAKCTIVEDGVMVQMLPEKLSSLKDSLKAMEDFRVSCGDVFSANSLRDQPVDTSSNTNDSVESTNHFLEIRWVGDDTNFNVGISSPVDFFSLEGIIGYNVQGKSEKKEKNQILRWNQVFFFKSTTDILDMSRLAERVANGCFQALLPHLKILRDSSKTKIGVRVNVHPDDVGYAVGSHGLPLPDPCLNALDDTLIQLTHEASANLQAEDDPVVFELIFSILDIRPSWKKTPPK